MARLVSQVDDIVKQKTKKLVDDAITWPLSPHADATHLITFDNSVEFADHVRIKETLKCDTFLAKPYRSKERGADENMNSELRRDYPKSQTLDNVDRFWLDFSVGLIQNRRRRVRGC